MEGKLSADRWLSLAASGTLGEALSRLRSDAPELVALHNTEELDLFTFAESGDMQSLKGPDFFMASNAFCKVLPLLDGSIERVMAAVEAMVMRGGSDMAAGAPNGALKAWLQGHPGQAELLVQRAQEGNALAARHLTFALETLGNTAKARELAVSFSDERRRGALTALSRLTDTEEGYMSSLDVLEQLASDGPTDEALAQFLLTTASLLSRNEGEARERAARLVTKIAASPGTQVRAAASQALWLNPELMGTSALGQLLDLLGDTEPKQLGTLGQIDYLTRHLLERGNVAAASRLVLSLLRSGGGHITIETFPGFIHGLLSCSPADSGKVAVDWLMSGDYYASEALTGC